MTRPTIAPLALTLAALLGGCAAGAAGGSAPALTSIATLRDTAGRAVGTVRLTERDEVVTVEAAVSGVAPGAHGIHFHAVGRCAPANGDPFGAAGGHYNPEQTEHGLENPRGAHAGDLPNIQVGADGSGRLETTTARLTLGTGPTSVYDADGTAVVLHAGTDDQRTNPAGDSGRRVACGVVQRR